MISVGKILLTSILLTNLASVMSAKSVGNIVFSLVFGAFGVCVMNGIFGL